MSNEHILTLSCGDKPGIVHAVTGIFAHFQLNILDLQQFSDSTSEKFFMRVHFGPTPTASTEYLRPSFKALSANYSHNYDIRPTSQKTRVLIMVSKIGHCLNNLLFRIPLHGS